jgi:hypothetical protein
LRQLHEYGLKSLRDLALVLAVVCVSASSAGATDLDAAKIPPNNYGCTLCHSGPSATVDFIPPGGSESFTSFGEQWLGLDADPDNRSWATMAERNADDDGCSNGYEMGDPDGDGLDVTPRSLNPSVTDCVLPLDEQSWGDLKSLFEN